MQISLHILIIVFGVASYVVGLREIYGSRYRPSLFSRIIWLLLAINSFAGVLFSGGSVASVVLATVFLVGNAAILLASIKRGARTFGSTEIFCTVLLMFSAVVWLFFDAPLVNLFVSLFAHLVGGIPTIKRAYVDPESESTSFWSLFFIASVISIIVSQSKSLSAIAFPLYYALFDGTMFYLSARRKSI